MTSATNTRDMDTAPILKPSALWKNGARKLAASANSTTMANEQWTFERQYDKFFFL